MRKVEREHCRTLKRGEKKYEKISPAEKARERKRRQREYTAITPVAGRWEEG